MAAVRQLMETAEGYDPKVWTQMSDEMELQGLAHPRGLRGPGFSVAELAVVLEEMGRALLCAPFFSSVALATPVILAAGTEAAEGRPPAGHRGRQHDRDAGAHRVGRNGSRDIAMVAVPDGAGTFRLDGSKTFVPDGHRADLIVRGPDRGQRRYRRHRAVHRGRRTRPD